MEGMEDGLFPSYMTITGDDPLEMEEERRLCYVGITRAKEDLTLTCARQRMVNGETRYSTASRFIKEIPFGLLDMKVPSVKMKQADEPNPSTYQRAKESFHQKPYVKPSAVRKLYSEGNPYAAALKKGAEIKTDGTLSYDVGDRVTHVKFGEGKVKEIKSGGRDYEVTVDFDTAGVKKMFASFAKLVKV
mgnify:CR=1 FL=1